jgi:hypothetical protein
MGVHPPDSEQASVKAQSALNASIRKRVLARPPLCNMVEP